MSLIAVQGNVSEHARALSRAGDAYDTEIENHVESGKPLLATCVGLIVAGRTDDPRLHRLALLESPSVTP